MKSRFKMLLDFYFNCWGKNRLIIYCIHLIITQGWWKLNVDNPSLQLTMAHV